MAVRCLKQSLYLCCCSLFVKYAQGHAHALLWIDISTSLSLSLSYFISIHVFIYALIIDAKLQITFFATLDMRGALTGGENVVCRRTRGVGACPQHSCSSKPSRLSTFHRHLNAPPLLFLRPDPGKRLKRRQRITRCLTFFIFAFIVQICALFAPPSLSRQPKCKKLPSALPAVGEASSSATSVIVIYQVRRGGPESRGAIADSGRVETN